MRKWANALHKTQELGAHLRYVEGVSPNLDAAKIIWPSVAAIAHRMVICTCGGQSGILSLTLFS